MPQDGTSFLRVDVFQARLRPETQRLLLGSEVLLQQGHELRTASFRYGAKQQNAYPLIGLVMKRRNGFLHVVGDMIPHLPADQVDPDSICITVSQQRQTRPQSGIFRILSIKSRRFWIIELYGDFRTASLVDAEAHCVFSVLRESIFGRGLRRRRQTAPTHTSPR